MDGSALDNTEDSSISSYDLPMIKASIRSFAAECGLRELNKTKKW